MTEQSHQANNENREKHLVENLGVDPNETDVEKMKFYPKVGTEKTSQELPRVWVPTGNGEVESWINTGEVDDDGRVILRKPETITGEDGKEKIVEKFAAPEALSQEVQSHLEERHKALEQEKRQKAEQEARDEVEKAYQEASARGEHAAYYNIDELRAAAEENNQ